jgi:hypothetical protein
MAVFDETMIHMDVESEDYDHNGNLTIDFTNGYRITISYDDCAESPREWDNVSTMLCWHSHYNLGDEQVDTDRYNNFEEIIADLVEEHGQIMWMPLYLYDHSGLAISTSAARFSAIDSAGWDWGCVGIAYIPHSKIIANWSNEKDGVTEDALNKAENSVKAEVEVYDDYVKGFVYCVSVEDADGNYVDSLGGIFGCDEARQEAVAMAEWHWNHFLAQTPVQGVLSLEDSE